MVLPSDSNDVAARDGARDASLGATSLYERSKLRLAGALNLVGDISLLAESVQSKSLPLKLAGWFYAIGASIITVFGAPQKEQLVRDLNERAAEFIQAQSGQTSDDLISSTILRQRDTGFTASISRMLRRYSAEVMLWFYTLGAGALLTHGVLDYQKAGSGGRKPLGDILVGATSLLVKTIALATPERARSSDDAPSNKNKSLIDWISEKPMRLFGYGSLATEGFWAYRTYEKYKSNHKWMWSATTTGSYMLSDIIIANTNKDAANAVGAMTPTEQTRLETMLAETIARQPKEQQAELASKAAEFLHKEPIIKGSTVQLRDAIVSRMAQLDHSRSKPSS